MVFRKISADMKERALHLLTEGWELPEIADVLGVSFKSINRWADNYDRHGMVAPPSYNTGRRRLLTAEAIDDLKELIDESPELYLDEIGEWLALYHDIPMSTTALHDNLRDLGLTRKIMRRQAAERDHALRTAWLHNVLNTYTAEQMVVVDETSKDGKTLIRKYGRATRGHDPVYTVSLNRGIRYSALPALTVKGYIAARAVEGSIDGGEFYDFIANDVVGPLNFALTFRLTAKYYQLPCMNPWPGPRSVLVLDNCATHKSEALQELFEGTGV